MIERLKHLLIGLLVIGLQPAFAEDILVIVSVDSPIQQLTIRQLANIYQRKTLISDQGIRWAPINLGADHPLRRAFSLEIYKQQPEDMESYWNIQYFKGITPPYVVSSQEAMLRFVTSAPGAIGYILPCRLNPTVRVVLTLPVSLTAPDKLACDDHPEQVTPQ